MKRVRQIGLLLLTHSVAAIGSAQAPLTIDPTFEYYITPEWIEQFGNSFEVIDISLRANGDIITSGNRLQPPGGPTGGSMGGTVLVNSSGQFVHSPFQEQGASGKITELENGQYFYGYKRFNSTGERDFTFGPIGLPWYSTSDWHVFDDRTVLVGGAFKLEPEGAIEYGLIKVDEWGVPDPSFTARRIGPGASRVLHTLEPLSNGQLLANGTFTTYDGESTGPVVRINADGSRDPSFYFPAWKGSIGVVLEQPDGKMILGGQFWMNEISDTLKVVRIHPDGSLDPTFNNMVDYRTGDNQYSAMVSGVDVLTPLGDGRIVVGGIFDRIDGQMRSCIACIDTLGNLLDCWANGGLVPETYSPAGYPYAQLNGFECLSNGDCYIFGEYKGFIDANGLHPRQCVMSRMYMPDVGVGEDGKLPETIQLWPNPGSNELQISVQRSDGRSFQLMDVCGRRVREGALRSTTTILDTSTLPNGVYMLHVMDQNGRVANLQWIKS